MGRVESIHAKGRSGEGGLYKPSIPEGQIGQAGLEGDFNHFRAARLKGDPDQALLLMPWETLEELNNEFWPVQPGDLGENFTTRGIKHDEFQPGQRYRIGDALIEVTRLCDPCRNLYKLSYVGSMGGAEFLKTLVGRRGWYARVLKPGLVRAGDPVDLIEDCSK
ncbi:MAG: MOSC domain-containing protein [Spirochaetales bacterium]|nr:MOSC domain-containing protein [Leptospiraceae bacterium]MCP5481678.1 MOSC domain-containing protein [Spirochaetales bacterium]